MHEEGPDRGRDQHPITICGKPLHSATTRHVGDRELVERVEPARIGQAQHHPDRAPVADDQRRQLGGRFDLVERLRDPVLLVAQRFATGEPELLAGA